VSLIPTVSTGKPDALGGDVLSDSDVWHFYTVANGLIERKDLGEAVKPSLDSFSHRSDTKQISWGKLNCLLCTAAESTLRIFDGYGLRSSWPLVRR
jgi:hypothetical protein